MNRTLLLFSTLVAALLIGGCSRSPTSNIVTSNTPATVSVSPAPAAPSKRSDSVYKFDKGGVQFELPAGWRAEKDQDGDVDVYGLHAKDGKLLKLITGSKTVSFEDVSQGLRNHLREKLGAESKPIGGPVQDTVNGMAHTTQSFLMQLDGEELQARLDSLSIGNKQILLISENSALTPEVKEGLSNLIKSIKKIE